MAVPQLVTITGKYTRKDGPDSGTVTFYQQGFVQSALSNEVLSPGQYVGTLDANGLLSMEVPSTDDPNWTPQNWTYRVIVKLSKSRDVFDMGVPAGSPGGTLDMGDVVPASQSGGDLYAPIAHTHAGGGGGSIDPSTTVSTSTAFGQGSTAGAAVTYSKGDHNHGTPAAPTAASVGAATTAHTHTGTYQPLDSDLTAIAALTPTTDNIVQSVAGAWSSRTPAQVRTALVLTPMIVLGPADPVPGGTPVGTVVVRTAT